MNFNTIEKRKKKRRDHNCKRYTQQNQQFMITRQLTHCKRCTNQLLIKFYTTQQQQHSRLPMEPILYTNVLIRIYWFDDLWMDNEWFSSGKRNWFRKKQNCLSTVKRFNFIGWSGRKHSKIYTSRKKKWLKQFYKSLKEKGINSRVQIQSHSSKSVNFHQLFMSMPSLCTGNFFSFQT